MPDYFEMDCYPAPVHTEKPRFISPPKSDLGNLRKPLTDGEKLVLEFFDRHLSSDWEIYIQPHLNGLCPDFVLLNPNVGIAVFEVKDWDLDAMKYEVVPREDRSPELYGSRDGKRFSCQSDNPVEKVIRYKKEIAELYCHRLNKIDHGFAAITAGVIFPFADDNRVFRLFEPSWLYRQMNENHSYYPISGQAALANGDLLKVFPSSRWQTSQIMTPELADDFRSWLVEADSSREQRTPLPLDKKQRRLAEDRTKSGYRRISGSAGSGKSIVLAARAANLIARGRSVLVVAFNITLLNYLADSTVRNNPAARKKATWLHFHRWCKRVCEEAGRVDEYTALYNGLEGEEEGSVPDKQLCQLVGGILDRAGEADVTRYDAILVDEGQDMQPEWWNLLRKVLKPGGEMVLVADTTQDVYSRAALWTETAMTGAGFTGDWTKLGVSYRMPPKLIDLVRSFGEEFLPLNNRDLPPSAQMELGDLWPCKLRWVFVGPGQAATGCFEEYNRLMRAGGKKLSVSDVTVLADTRELGAAIVEQFDQRGINCLNTFAADKRVQRSQKLGFHKGSEKIKATTLHSFKGWESRAILLCLGQKIDQRSLALVYAGLTRLKREETGSFLTVICADPGLTDYGKSWPEFEDLSQSNWPQSVRMPLGSARRSQVEEAVGDDVPLPPEPWEDSFVERRWEEFVPESAEETFGLNWKANASQVWTAPPPPPSPPRPTKSNGRAFAPRSKWVEIPILPVNPDEDIPF